MESALIILEKLEECPDCGERKFWFYDGQMCANCGYGEPASQPAIAIFHQDRMDAWLKELWSSKSIDLHLCDGSRRENQFGLLRNIRRDVMDLRKHSAGQQTAMAKLLVAAKILLANANNCASQHNFHCDGEPGWLVDCRRDIEAAERCAALARRKKISIERNA